MRWRVLLAVMAAVGAAAVGTTLASAAVPAFTDGPTRFLLERPTQGPIGPVGSRFTYSAWLVNRDGSFGKRPGARVGRVLVECTVVVDTPDGYCTGIVRVPDGFFTIVGRGLFSHGRLSRWAVTGGLWPYHSGLFEFVIIRKATRIEAELRPR